MEKHTLLDFISQDSCFIKKSCLYFSILLSFFLLLFLILKPFDSFSGTNNCNENSTGIIKKSATLQICNIVKLSATENDSALAYDWTENNIDSSVSMMGKVNLNTIPINDGSKEDKLEYTSPASTSLSASFGSPICSGNAQTVTFNASPISNANTHIDYWNGTGWVSGPGGATSVSISTGALSPGRYTYWARVHDDWGVDQVAPTAFILTVLPPVTMGATSANPTSVCPGTQVNLTTSGTSSGNATLMSGGLTGTDAAGLDYTPGWTVTHNSSSTADYWYVAYANGYVYNSETFTPGSYFAMANGDAGGSGSTTDEYLISPSVNTIGFTSLNLTFNQYYYYYSGDGAYVDVSTNNSTWTNVASYTSTQGSAGSFQATTINLNSYVGQATLYVRFHYVSSWGWYWAITNVGFSGNLTSACSYNWTATPACAGFPTTIQNPQAYPTQNTTFNVTVSNGACTNTGSASVIVNPAGPAQPGAITGNTSVCAGTSQTYSISSVPNATSYTWSVPAGWNITGGQGTLSLTVTSGSGGQNGNISVIANGSCGSSTASTLAVTVNSGPGPADAITGTANVCPVSSHTYSISAIPGATNYTWTVPIGWTITAGQGSTSITVTSGTAGQNGNITVTPSNLCGNGSSSSLAVTVNTNPPATPGTISGNTNVCPGTSEIYSIAAVLNATSYTWTVPTGWSITSGQGSTSLTVYTGAGGQNGNITVTANGSCGNSSPASLAVVVLSSPGSSGPITGNTQACPSSSQTYSISPVVNATTYTWTVPAGWSITNGQGTTSITVTSGVLGQNGNIAVLPSNPCGAGSLITLPVTINTITLPTPAGIIGNTHVCPASSATYNIVAVPGATFYTWTVPTGWTITNGQGTTNLTVNTGAYGDNGYLNVTANSACGTSTPASLAVIIDPSAPNTPGTISGGSPVCPFSSQSYSVSSVLYATTYNWTVPTGWVITGGQGTTTLSVTTGDYGQDGNVVVVPANACGNGVSSSFPVTISLGVPITPGIPTGNTSVCPVNIETYTTTAVPNSTYYFWTVPAGWTIIYGQYTTSVTVVTGNFGQNGNISVTANNDCGSSPSASLAVSANGSAPATPGPITGNILVCPATTQVYSISTVPDATSYTWSVPTGWTVVSGDGTISITVTAGDAGQGGDISVVANGPCGISPPSTITTIVNPAAPGSLGSIFGSATVCPGVSETYSVLGIPDATTYTWSFPTGWTISSGQGTTSVTLTTGATGDDGILSVVASNSCGSTAPASTTVTVSPASPATPGTISGNITVCPGTSEIYTITSVPNATSYTWSVPTGWSIVSGQGTTSLTVNTGVFGQDGNLMVTADNSCGSSTPASQAVTINPDAPVTPGAISGNTLVCSASSQIYSIASVPNATSYTWSVPSDWTITSGQGTISINVTAGSTGQNGDISVTANGTCGTSTASALTVSVSPPGPAVLGVITGSANACPAVNEIYSVAIIPDATTYTWSVPTGWTITSGQGTSSVNVVTGATGDNGDISVVAGNICGSSTPSTLAVTVLPAIPAVPGTISGNTAVCPGTSETYSIPAVLNATSYTWVVPAGWSITSGQGTTSVTVNTGTFGQNGNITVTSDNSCGSSLPSSLSLTVNPAIPVSTGAITGNDHVCPSISQSYSISAIADATSYLWTVPTGWTITNGQNTTSITVTTGSTGQNGTIIVLPTNSCGSGSLITLGVTVDPGTPVSPATISGNISVCPGTSETYNISSVPDATSYTWTVPAGWSIVTGQGSTSLTVNTGSFGQDGDINVTADNSCGSSLPATVAVTINPAPPISSGSISGNTTVCPAISQTYSISAITDATNYTWTIPTGWTISGGQGTTSLTVTTGNTGQNGSITVQPDNSCGTGSIITLGVNIIPGTPVSPVSITGNTYVCPGTSETYNILAVPDASTYTWAVPSGWNITSGQGTISIIVNTGTFGQDGDITVTAENSCGTSLPTILSITVNPATPVTPGAISGSSTVCPGTSQAYTIAAVPYATDYTWTVPSGWTITGGQGTTTVNVTTGSFGQDGSISVIASNSCGSSASSSIAIAISAPPPVSLGAVSGNVSVCPGISATYSVLAIPDATIYFWSVPSGWTIVSGQGTTSITVTTGAMGNDGDISVIAGNSCGQTPASTLGVTVLPAIPVTPALISGNITVCPGTSETYNIATVPNATSYTWTVPAGWNISSGQGTTVINVNTGSFGQNGNITVFAGNSCGNSSITSLAVTINPPTPVTPGVISASALICPGTIQAFTITSVPNATTYTWSVPIGWTINSGQGSTTIITTAGNAGQNGNVSVTAGNSCGTSLASSTAVIVSPAAPVNLGVIAGTSNVCPAVNGTYSVSAIPDATTYTWSIPAGWTINSGQGTTSISITTGLTGNNGTISVIASNTCGATSPVSLAVTVLPAIPSIPGAITGNAQICPGTLQIYSISAVADATTYTWTVPTGWTINGGQGTTSITVTGGNAGQNGTIGVIAGNSCGSSSSPSTLAVIVNSNPIANAGPDISICNDSQTTLNATGAINYAWSPATGLNFTNIANPVASPTSSQIYTVTVTDANGCTASDSLTVTVFIITPASAGTDQTICNGESATLNATGGVSYSWTPIITLNNATYQNPVATPSSTTTYIVTTTDANGCTSSDNVVVNVNPNVTAHAGADVSICSGGHIQLNASGGTTYIWSPVNGLNVPTIANPVASPLSTTTYVVTVSNSFGCSATDDIKVTVNQSAIASAGNDVTICSGNSIQLFASGGFTYSWSPAAGLSSYHISDPFASPVTTTQYVVTVTTGAGCTDVDSVTVFVNQTPTVDAGNAVTICKHQTTELNASGGSNYLWNNGINTASNNVSPNITTLYTVTISDSAGCSASDTVTVSVLPYDPPVISSNVPAVFCFGVPVNVTLDAGTGYSTYLWSDGSSSQTLNISAPGSFYVIGTASNGCSDTSNIIQVTSLPAMTPPVILSSGALSFCQGTSMSVDLYTNNPYYLYEWSSGSVTPSIHVTHSGTFTVTVTDFYGCTSVSSNSIQVQEISIPVTYMSYSAHYLSVNFYDYSYYDTGYYWKFGDGVTSTFQNPNHAYAAAGTYLVTFITSNSCGSDSTSMYITVVNGVGIDESSIVQNLSIYPVPTQDILNVSFEYSNNKIVELNIVNTLGQTIYTEKSESVSGQYNKVLHLAGYPAGVYYLQINTDKGIVNRKFIVN